jgi:regulator of protease activity HflC (stomatin/prohibitin superfamily)
MLTRSIRSFHKVPVGNLLMGQYNVTKLKSAIPKRFFSEETKTENTQIENSKNDQQKVVNNATLKKLDNTGSLSGFEHLIRIVAGTALCPFGFYKVTKNHKTVVEYFGKYFTTKNEGLRYNLPFSMKLNEVFVGLRSFNVEKSKVVDKAGNPIIISAIVNYHVEDPVKYVYDVERAQTFVEHQTNAVVKEISSKYSYNELKNETDNITQEAIHKIRERVEIAGIVIDRMNITDLSYAPEIAQMMLVKQQAQVHIEARETIINASVDIVNGTLEKLGNRISDKAKEKITINLMTVLSSNSGTQGVIKLN